MIIQGKAAEYALLQKLASFTKIPKTEFVRETIVSEETHEVLPLVQYPVLDERVRGGFNPLFYCVTAAGRRALNLLHLIDPNKWRQSPVREAFHQGGSYVPSSHVHRPYVLITQLAGMVWATTYRSLQSIPLTDAFIGGILVQDSDEGGVYLTQPIRGYLTEQLGAFMENQ